MNFGGSTIQPTTDVVHTHRGNLENRDKKKEVKRSRFNHSEITAVNISELSLFYDVNLLGANYAA